MELKNYFAQDTLGNALPGAFCYVYNPGTTAPATGVVDKNGNPLASPFVSDANALIQFAAPNGMYDLRVVSGEREFTLKVQCADVTDTIEDVTLIVSEATSEADRAESAAEAAETAAEGAATAGAAAGTAAAQAVTARFLPPAATDYVTRPGGGALQIGDRYLNTTGTQPERIYKASGWYDNSIDMDLLADPEGAGQVGYSAAESYEAGTVGRAVKDLPDSIFNTLGADDGATKLGYKNPAATSTATDAFKLLGLSAFPETFAEILDYNTNSTAVLQKVVEIIGRQGGGKVQLAAGKSYYIPGTVILPTKVQLDLNGAEIRGNLAGGATATTIVSGYFNGSGVLVTNLTLADEEVIIEDLRIYNGRFKEVYKGVHLRNCNMSCSLEQLEFYNTTQAIHTERCFLMRYKDIQARLGTPGVPTYRFSDGAHNSMVLDQVRAVTPFGFSFEGSGASIVLLCCDFEGGVTGFHFEGGPFYNITWVGGYFEAITGTLYDVISLLDESNFYWIGTYNYLVKTMMNSPATGILKGRFDESNTVLGIGSTVEGNTYPATFNVNSATNRVKIAQLPALSESAALPVNINITGNAQADYEQVRYQTSENAPTTKSLVRHGLLPLSRSGDVGAPPANKVPLCTHQAFNPGASTIIILLTTGIKWQPNTQFVKYCLTVVAGGVTTKIAGDVYGDIVKPADGTGKSVVAVNAGGFLRLELYGYTDPAGAYTCTGSVQLMV